ncbi:restriction endonuclease subunit S [Epilithonimonas sp.]|uniref:restriction endonuclease subunit S n=1 Tax=Epilithonimonas sp. TaxID=2894511 RepID=UPI00289958F4|nr:restriction endonuclease subunit S [Epilithonimonas sp.]
MNSDNNLVPTYRFPEFKDDGNWEISTIKSLAEIKGRIGYRGYTTSDIVEKGKGAITLSPSNIIDGRLNFDKATYISWDKYDESPEIMLEEGHTVLVKTASVGKTAYISNLPEKTTLNPQIVVLKAYDKIDKKLLSYCISHDFTQQMILNKVGAGAIPNLSQESIGNIEITYPTNPAEQQKIAACLSSLDDVIAGHEEKLTALEEHKKGLMQNLFPQEGETQPKYRFPEFENDGDWVEKKLSEIGVLVNGLTYSPNDVSTEGILVLRSSNVQNSTISLEDNVYVNKTINEVNPIKLGDILICVRNGSKSLIGKNALIRKDMPNATHGAFMTVFRSQQFEFVYQLFQSDLFFKQVHTDLGATINSINGRNLLNYKFVIPKNPLEQQKIASVLSSVDELIVAQREKIEALKKHKKGLMQGLFPKIES